MFTETTQEGRTSAPIQAPALNSTIWGGLGAAVATVGAATTAIFSAMNTSELEVRVAIVAGVTLVISVGLWAVVTLVRSDAQIRLSGATAKKKDDPKTGDAVPAPAAAEGTNAGVVWITPPSMHVYSIEDPESALQVILVGMNEDKIYYYAAAAGGRPRIFAADAIDHVQLGEHQFR